LGDGKDAARSRITLSNGIGRNRRIANAEAAKSGRAWAGVSVGVSGC
jgi:hypothetical protein